MGEDRAEKMHVMLVRMPPDLYERLRAVATANDRSMAGIVRKATNQFLEGQQSELPSRQLELLGVIDAARCYIHSGDDSRGSSFATWRDRYHDVFGEFPSILTAVLTPE